MVKCVDEVRYQFLNIIFIRILFLNCFFKTRFQLIYFIVPCCFMLLVNDKLVLSVLAQVLHESLLVVDKLGILLQLNA